MAQIMIGKLTKNSSSSSLVKRIVASRKHTRDALKNHQRSTSFPLSEQCTKLYFSTSSTTTSKSNETVKGVWIFHRHGDRSPGKALVADHMIEAESQFWRTKIPPTDKSYFHALSTKYPTLLCQGKFLDLEKEPFGFLSWKGMDQMYDTGKSIGERYFEKGQTSADFVMDWDLKAYSTNYLRTVMSVQCFMDGLLYSSMEGVQSDKEEEEMKHSYENVSVEYLQSSREELFSKNSNDDGLIQVRDRKEDTLNSFDKNPEKMKKLVSDVNSTSSFINIDSKAGCLAARLANFLPGLAKASSYGGPSGINWIHAADHFVCRSSHDLPFSKFSQSEHDPNAEQTLNAMRYGVISHLCWRFRTWYQNLPLLAAVASPPLDEVCRDMLNTLEGSGSTSADTKKPFVVYSCHDVTVLSLLYGIGADFLAPTHELISIGISPGNDERWRFWPKYASTLVFELVQRDNDSAIGTNNNNEDDESHFVRILLNGEEVRPIKSLKKNKEYLSISEFKEVIDELMIENEDKFDTEIMEEERGISTSTG